MRPDSLAVVIFQLSKRSVSDDSINLLKISPFGVIPSDIKTVYMLYWAVHVIFILWMNQFWISQTVKILVHWYVLISLTLAPLVKTYQFCMPFCFSTEQYRTSRVDWVQLGLVIELNRTHKKVPVWLHICLIGFDWFLVRFRSIGYAGRFTCIAGLSVGFWVAGSIQK